MSTPNNNHDLFSASLESIETSKRVEKFQRFKNDFQRESNATLDNAQEWIKAELPIITDYIDATAIKDELKQTKTSNRRKHLLSALLFEKNLRESIVNNDAVTAAIMAMHMFNNMWQAKVELHGSLPTAAASINTSPPSQSSSEIANQTYNDTSEKILTTLIKKGEKLKNSSQIQSRIKSKSRNKATPKKSKQQVTSKPKAKSSNKNTKKKTNAWAEEIDKEKQRNILASVNDNKIKDSALV